MQFKTKEICNDLVPTKKMKITELKCEHRTSDYSLLGIGTAHPRFSWNVVSEEKGCRQVSYRLKVMENNEIIWDSGMIASEQCFGIRCEAALKEQTAYHWQVQVQNQNGEWADSEEAFFETGFFSLKSWPAVFLTCKGANGKPDAPEPIHVRKSFWIEKGKTIQAARLYAAATTGVCASLEGLMRNLTFANNQYLLWLNGTLVSEEVQNPGQISEKKWRALYRTYDVTDLLQKEENVLGSVFVSMGFSVYLQITYTDGSIQKIGCEDMVRNDRGPYCLWDEGVEDQCGKREHYDATREFTGWNCAGYDASDWKPALFTDVVTELSEQYVITKACAKLEPCSVDQRDNDRYIFDFGENMNGNLSLVIRGCKRGTEIRIRHAEVLSESGELEPFGTVNFARGETDAQTDIYITRGEAVEQYTPKFAMHGFRYAEVTGIADLKKEDVRANVIHSPLASNGSFFCSDELINRMYEMSRRTQRNNLVSIPTDCPHRERHGWLGDAMVVCEAECLNYDMTAFLENWMQVIADDLPKSGVVQYISPFHSRFLHEQIDIPWSTACIEIPWRVYQESGDSTILKRYFPVMKAWLACLERISEDGLIPKDGIKWNDHTCRQKMEDEYLSALYFYYGLCRAAQIGEIIGEETEYNEKAQKVKDAINERWYQGDHYSQGLQSDHAHALAFGIVPQEAAAALAERLAASLQETETIDAGCLGIWTMIPVLAAYGYNDMVWKLAHLTCNGSWGGWIENRDATTAFEYMFYRDETHDKVDYSYDHPFLMGSINAWFYRELAGIRQSEPGYRRFLIQPYCPEELSFVNGELQTPYGTIRVDWKKENEQIIYHLEIPCSTEAIVYAPSEAYVLTEDYPVSESELNQNAIVLQSGVYVLTYQKK